MLYLSYADTVRLDIRMTDVVPAIEEAFRRVGNGQAVVAPRLRVVHPPLEKSSMGKGRPWVRDLRVWSPTPAHRRECVEYLQGRLGAGIKVRAVENSEAAIRGAEIVTTATKSLEPVMQGEWLSPGCTVLCNTPEEVDQETFLRAKIVTTYSDGILSHVPPYHALVELVEAGKLSEQDFSTELGDIVAGKVPGRSSDNEIIVGLNPAFGILDAATADFVYRRAKQMGIGTELEA